MKLHLEQRWPELVTLLFLVVGFMIATGLEHVGFSYVTAIIAGFLAGRLYYTRRRAEPILPFILIILGFFAGYLIGNFHANRVVILLFFVVSLFGSYYLHHYKIIAIFKSERFLK